MPILSRSRATGKLQATLKLICYIVLVVLFFFVCRFFWGSSIAQFAISTSFCIQSGPEVGIVILFFKNLSRSRATGNLQATLNGTFLLGKILILSRSLAKGKLQATLKLICYLFLNLFFFSNFKNLSRSLAKGNLQATLNGIFFCGKSLF